MNKIILIDGDILVYEIGFSVEKPMYIVNGNLYKRKGYAEAIAKQKGAEVFKRISYGDIKDVKRNLQVKMHQICDNLGTSNYRIFITASGIEENFRFKLGTIMPYKGNRRKSVKPLFYNKIRKILVEDYKAELVHGQEADDMIGIIHTEYYSRFSNYEYTYIATIDKDLRTIPGWHYHLKLQMIDYIDEETALKNFYTQLLTGDVVDNIPGLVRILKLEEREEEANKLIYGHYLSKYTEFKLEHSAKECYDYVVDLYSKHNIATTKFDEIGSLLWIRRHPEENWVDSFGGRIITSG